MNAASNQTGAKMPQRPGGEHGSESDSLIAEVFGEPTPEESRLLKRIAQQRGRLFGARQQTSAAALESSDTAHRAAGRGDQHASRQDTQVAKAGAQPAASSSFARQTMPNPNGSFSSHETRRGASPAATPVSHPQEPGLEAKVGEFMRKHPIASVVLAGGALYFVGPARVARIAMTLIPLFLSKR